MCVKITKNTPVSLYCKILFFGEVFQSSFFVNLYLLARGWKIVTRRCANINDVSSSWNCRYYVDDFGLYVEACYCSDNDGCNSSVRNKCEIILIIFIFIFKKLFY